MRGLDAELLADDVRVDPAPLSALGELLALAAGVHTYELHWRGRYEIDPRELWHIQSRAPGELFNTDVVAAHVCTRTQTETLKSRMMLGHKQSTQSEHPPF